MPSRSPRTRLIRWLAPSSDASVRRLVVAGVAGVLLTAPLSIQPLVAAVQPLGYALAALGALLAICCCRRAWTPSRGLTWLATIVCVGFATATITQGIGQVSTGLRSTDSQLLCADDVSPSIVAGGQEVLHGSNPYTTFNVVRAERSFGCPSFHVTPLRGGLFASRSTSPTDAELNRVAQATIDAPTSTSVLLGFSYPAGSALLGILGAHGIVLLNVLGLLGASAGVVVTSPRGSRRWVALALAAQTGALVLVGPTRPDGVVAALLIIACARDEAWLSGVSLGLACAIKQTAWFVAPALLMVSWRRGGRHGLIQTVATLAMFAVVNLPFAIADPAAWFRGTLAPSSAGFPLGGGPVGLFLGAGRPTVVIGIFTAVMVLTLVAGAGLAWRGRSGWAQAGVIVSSLALWDGARSLLYYFGLLGLVAVSVCTRELLARSAPARRQLDLPTAHRVPAPVL